MNMIIYLNKLYYYYKNRFIIIILYQCYKIHNEYNECENNVKKKKKINHYW